MGEASGRSGRAGTGERRATGIDRRTFLGALPLAAAAVGCGGASSSPDAAGGAESGSASVDTAGREPLLAALGVQLYTLRGAIAEDLDAVLASVAEIGYTEVELFQLHGLTPAEMRARLDAVGLRAASSHYDLGLLRGDLDRHVDGALELGQSLMVVPWLDEADRTVEGLARTTDDLERIGAAVRDAGMRLGYHNHDFEFAEVVDAGGATIMEVLLERTDPDLVDWQMDIYWTVNGGQDPVAMLGAHSGRITSVHVKDRRADGAMVDVGDGEIDFATVVRAAERQGLRHAFVEHDNPVDATESVRKAHTHLRSIGVVA